MSERVEILGVKVDAVTMAQAVERVENLIAEKKSSLVARRRLKKNFERGKFSCS